MTEKIEEILADIKQEGETDPFAILEKETPTDSPAEKEPKEEIKEEKEEVEESKEEVKEEENIPFHKHPRWIERESKLKELEDIEQKHAQEIAELKTLKNEPTNESITIPDWFKELYGDNEVAWNKYSQHDREQRESIKKEILDEQTKVTQQQAEEVTRWNKWVASEIDKLAADGKKFDRNELIKTMLEYRPTDEKGNFDFSKGYEIYNALRKDKEDPAKIEARKKLADTATKTSPAENKKKDYMTSSELRHKSWGAL